MRILVSGSRTWDDYDTIEREINRALGDELTATIVHGGAAGADTLAAHAAHAIGLGIEVHPADWKQYGRGAGYRRNQEMVKAGADICLAFIRSNSRGASHCAAMAERAGIPVRRFTS